MAKVLRVGLFEWFGREQGRSNELEGRLARGH
jgi:hypothetical protein